MVLFRYCITLNRFLTLIVFLDHWVWTGKSRPWESRKKRFMTFMTIQTRFTPETCSFHCVQCVQIRSFSGPYFLVFGLNKDQKKLCIWILFTQCLLQICSYKALLTEFIKKSFLSRVKNTKERSIRQFYKNAELVFMKTW